MGLNLPTLTGCLHTCRSDLYHALYLSSCAIYVIIRTVPAITCWGSRIYFAMAPTSTPVMYPDGLPSSLLYSSKIWFCVLFWFTSFVKYVYAKIHCYYVLFSMFLGFPRLSSRWHGRRSWLLSSCLLVETRTMCLSTVCRLLKYIWRRSCSCSCSCSSQLKRVVTFTLSSNSAATIRTLCPQSLNRPMFYQQWVPNCYPVVAGR